MKIGNKARKAISGLLLAFFMFSLAPTPPVSAAATGYKFNITSNVPFDEVGDNGTSFSCLDLDKPEVLVEGLEAISAIDIDSSVNYGIQLTNYYTDFASMKLNTISINNYTYNVNQARTFPAQTPALSEVGGMTGTDQSLFALSATKAVKLLIHFTYITPTQDVNIRFNFETDYTPSYTLSSGVTPAGSGAVTPVYVDKDGDNDKWMLTAAPATGYQFKQWEDGSTSSARNVIVTTEGYPVGESGPATYTAEFEPVQLALRNSFNIRPSSRASLPNSVTSGGNFWPSTYSVSNADVYEGQRAALQINYSLLGPVAEGTPVSFAVYAGEEASGTPLASYSGQFYNGGSPILAGNWSLSFVLNQMPAIDKVTVTAKMGDNETVTRTYDITVKESAPLSLTYLTKDYGDIRLRGLLDGATLERGPNFNDVLAFVNDETGELTIYAAGMLGVFEWDGNTFSLMNGLSLGVYDNLDGSEYVYAIGGASGDELTALVKTSSAIPGHQTGYRLYRYTADSGQWTEVADSFVAQVSELDSIDALVIGHDDVWIQNRHWDGTGWQANELAFTGFYKAGTNYYANTASGAYKYDADTKTWEAVGVAGLEGTLQIQKVNFGGTLLVKAGGTVYLVKDGETPVALPSTDTLIYERPGVELFDIGLDGDDNVYVAISGRDYNMGSFSAKGTYIFKLVDGAWQYQVTDAFLGPQDSYEEMNDKYRPEMVRDFYSVADNVTVLAGVGGTTYLLDKTTTITFNSNGGSAVQPVTGPAWSTVAVPRPTREGYTFAGWYYDNGIFDEPWVETVIPVYDVTLYAKWVEESGEDRYAQDRENALKQLRDALERMDEADYSPENWDKILLEYENGIYAIQVAKPKPENESEEAVYKAVMATIYAAANTAINRMQAIPPQVIKDITVAVSMDANTIGLGYIIKPTLVTVPKGTKASKVIVDLLEENGLNWEGMGDVNTGFYLAQVYPVVQTGVNIADYILAKTGDIDTSEGSIDTKLGEFDYYGDSGWMYSIGSEGGAPSFPGVGASSWYMGDREVMRWQFTVYGYGADLNADNSSWGKESIVPDLGDKIALTWKVAELRSQHEDSELEANEDYNAAMNVLTDPTATQGEVDSALAALVGMEMTEEEAVAKAKTVVQSLGYTVTMDTANSEQEVKAWIESEIAKLELYGVTATVAIDSFNAAVAGTDGGFTFTVNLSKGEGESKAEDSVQITGTIDAEPFAGGEVYRTAGGNRYDTSAKTALQAYPDGVDTVIIARGDDEGNFADALAASYLAGVENASILLTSPGSLPQEIEDAIKKLGATKAYVLGGELAVSQTVADKLNSLGLQVERIQGQNRYATAAAIAAKGGQTETAIVVGGFAPADSLVAGPLAFSQGYPILLVDKNSVPAETKKAIADLGIEKIIVVGGENAVSKAVYNELKTKERYAGHSRIETSLDVAEKAFAGAKDFSIVGYLKLADAVGAAVNGNLIIYVKDNIADVKDYLTGAVAADTNFTIFGGPLAVSDTVEDELKELLK